MHLITLPWVAIMVSRVMSNNLVKIKYLFTINQKLNLKIKIQVTLTPLLTGNKPPHYPPKHRPTITATQTSRSLRMTMPRLCSQFQHFFNNLRAAIRQRQMPSQTVISSSNNNPSNCRKFTPHTLTSSAHTIIMVTNIIITISAALMPLMNLVSPVRPLELPKRRNLSIKKSDSSSTKKSRR